MSSDVRRYVPAIAVAFGVPALLAIATAGTKWLGLSFGPTIAGYDRCLFVGNLLLSFVFSASAAFIVPKAAVSERVRNVIAGTVAGPVIYGTLLFGT